MPLPRAEQEEVGFVAMREAGDLELMRLDLRRFTTVPASKTSLLDRVREEIATRCTKRVPARS